MKYRAEIDGLRALAVIPVILFHLGIKLFSGGFVGVDVFFVISGYLITTILIEDLEDNRFNIVKFYERRARRILPALTLVSLIALFAAWILLGPASLNRFGNSLIGVAIFSSNFMFWKLQGYFDENAELNPLLHTWSLAVEEQFYLVFPIFLFLTWRFSKNRVFWIIIIFTIFSFALSEWAWRKGGAYSSANFYLAPTRAWELFAGSIVAFIIHKNKVKTSNLYSSIGLGAILFSIFVYNESTPFPSAYALVPVVGVMLLLLYGRKDTLVARLLSAKVFVSVGLISYSAYLWHQPIIAFYRIYKGSGAIEYFPSLILLTLTFILAALSWKFIETPFRKREFLTTTQVLTLSVIMMLILGALGYFSKLGSKGHEERLAKTLAENQFVYFNNMDERKFIQARLKGVLDEVPSVVVGSSRIMQFGSYKQIGKILNLSVSGASIEDNIAFLPEAVMKLKPNSVFIGADPWILNENSQQTRYKSIEGLYHFWLKAIMLKDSKNDTKYFVDTKNFDDQSHNSLERFFRYVYKTVNLKDAKSVASHGKPEVEAKKAYNGFHIYPKTELHTDPSILASDLDAYLDYGMEEFSYKKSAETSLVNLLLWLKNKGIEVVLLLAPYHPDLFLRMQKERPIFLELEQKFRDIAFQQEIQIIGSYDPNIVGCTSDEFYDVMHPKESCMQKVVSKFKSALTH